MDTSRFHSFRDRDEIEAWHARLLNNRPARLDVARHLCAEVGRLGDPHGHLVELCCGSGLVAEMLLDAYPRLTYTGLDFSAPLLDYASERLARFAPRVALVPVDLNDTGWPNRVNDPVNAIVSMQSLHDLGNEENVVRVYGLAAQLLAPGGLFLNADLVVPLNADRAENPGRMPIERHLDHLKSLGYPTVDCTLKVDDYACCIAVKNGKQDPI